MTTSLTEHIIFAADMRFKFFLITLLLATVNQCLIAQEGNFSIAGDPMQIHIEKAKEEIVLDGQLNEQIWGTAERLTNFTQNFPTDTLLACGETEIYFTYDENNFYIAAKCYTAGSDFSVQSLKRDYGFGGNDNISFMLDTYNDQTNAYLFGMNPFGARREALISDGGQSGEDFNDSWDNKWDGESKMYEGYWICELAIPFKSIRYKAGNSKWRFNSYRNDAQCNEITSFINIPRENILMDLQYTAELNMQEPLRTPKKNLALIPYISGGTLRDFENIDELEAVNNFSVGGDAKIAVSSSLNLDLTYNPDFSQVEVDQQVTNLDRFEIFFPERRQFFLENADLFSGFGSDDSRPFFSRRIGISLDTTTDNNIQNRIYGGARLTGKLNENLRIGVLNMQTAAQKENDLPSINYTVAALEQQLSGRSNLGFIFVNKQSINDSDFGNTTDPYDRVMGLEYRLKSKNNKWDGKHSFLKALTPNDLEDKFSSYTTMQYNVEKFRIKAEALYIGDGFDSEVGFVPRRDVFIFSPGLDYRFFPKDRSVISQHTLSIEPRLVYKMGKDDNLIIPERSIEEKGIEIEWSTRYTKNNNLNFTVNHTEFTLLDDFDPTRIQEDDVFISAGSEIKNTRISLSYRSDRRKIFSYRVAPVYGFFFGGNRVGLSGRFDYRLQPFVSFGLEYNLNRIVLDGQFEDANLYLVGPRVEVTFTKQLFWTTFIQYNNQTDNLNINSRFQWRFAPVSDFFLVYTNNYDTTGFNLSESRNRALVAKLTYWLNL